MATMPEWLKHVMKFLTASWIYKGSIPFRSTNTKIMEENKQDKSVNDFPGDNMIEE